MVLLFDDVIRRGYQNLEEEKSEDENRRRKGEVIDERLWKTGLKCG